jgi:hypothetical protein
LLRVLCVSVVSLFILLSQTAINDARTQSLPLPVLTPPYSIA